MCELLSIVPHGAKFGGQKNELRELFVKEQKERAKQTEIKTPENKETFEMNFNIEQMVNEMVSKALASPPVEL